MGLNSEKKKMMAGLYGTVDELLQADTENKLTVQEIPLADIDDLDPAQHPFYKTISRNIDELAESIKIAGVLEPVILVRDGNRYISLSGHRRRMAARLAGLETIPAIVRDNISPELADIIITDTNLNSRDLLPSERGKAYEKQLEALKKQGKRTDLIKEVESVDEELERANMPGVTARDIIADRYQTTATEISKYIRVAEKLDIDLLDMVDDEKISLRAGYILSFLERQKQLILSVNCPSISIKEAEKIRDIPDAAWDGFLDAKDVFAYIKRKPEKEISYSAAEALKAAGRKFKRNTAYLPTKEAQDELEELLYRTAEEFIKNLSCNATEVKN